MRLISAAGSSSPTVPQCQLQELTSKTMPWTATATCHVPCIPITYLLSCLPVSQDFSMSVFQAFLGVSYRSCMFYFVKHRQVSSPEAKVLQSNNHLPLNDFLDKVSTCVYFSISFLKIPNTGQTKMILQPSTSTLCLRSTIHRAGLHGPAMVVWSHTHGAQASQMRRAFKNRGSNHQDA